MEVDFPIEYYWIPLPLRSILSSIFNYLLNILLSCKDTEKADNHISSEASKKVGLTKPTVSFTFDDGITSDLAGFEFEDWNNRILSHLEKEQLKAVFFVTDRNKLDEKGQCLLRSWNDKGHQLANHTFSHPNFNAEENTPLNFQQELSRTDNIISQFSNSAKLFRFPYLKEGENPEKVDSIRTILKENNYQNGYVTIDASDWYVNQRLIQRINNVGLEKTPVEKFKDFYLDHILERANYYEKLSYELTGRHISHTLLLHHNLTSALFLGDLIDRLEKEGWNVIDADEAYKDPIFKNIPKSEFAGESLIYSLVKQTEKYDQSLRYPAEDSRYEKGRMDKLGL